MPNSIRTGLCFVVMAMCWTTSCGQAPQNKLIDQINAAKVEARKLSADAERKRTEAREKSQSSDQAEHDKLIDEAAKLYERASETLNEVADKSAEIAKLKSPPWYEEYFTLQSKLIRNQAQLAHGAHDELVARKNGRPAEALVQSWKENIDRISKENEQFRKQIAAIESREGIVLIKE